MHEIINKIAMEKDIRNVSILFFQISPMICPIFAENGRNVVVFHRFRPFSMVFGTKVGEK